MTLPPLPTRSNSRKTGRVGLSFGLGAATTPMWLLQAVLTATGRAVVSAAGAANAYLVCPDCLNPAALIKEADARVAAIKPVLTP